MSIHLMQVSKAFVMGFTCWYAVQDLQGTFFFCNKWNKLDNVSSLYCFIAVLFLKKTGNQTNVSTGHSYHKKRKIKKELHLHM